MKFFVTGVGGQLGHDVMNELVFFQIVFHISILYDFYFCAKIHKKL